ALTLCADDFFAGRMNLNLQTVNAAVDLDNERLQIDGSSFVLDKGLSGRFNRRRRFLDGRCKARAIFIKIAKLAFEGEQRFIRTVGVVLAGDEHSAAEQHVAVVIDQYVSINGVAL